MIETRVRVLRADDDTAWVEPTEVGGCAACQAGSSCAVSGLGRFLSSRRHPIPISTANASPGDEITLVTSEAELLKVGLLAYLIPAVMAVGGAVLAAGSGGGDLAAVVGTALGFAAGLLIARRLARPVPPRVRPKTLS